MTFKIEASPKPVIVGKIKVGNNTYTKYSNGEVWVKCPNPKHLPGEVYRVPECFANTYVESMKNASADEKKVLLNFLTGRK